MSLVDTAHAQSRPAWLALDKLGVLIALIAIAGAVLPFALFRANRIVLGEPVGILGALPSFPAGFLVGMLLIGFAVALLRFPVTAKLAAGFGVLATLLVLIGQSASYLTPAGHRCPGPSAVQAAHPHRHPGCGDRRHFGPAVERRLE
jgi:osmoprotectant transport system permease protein